MAYIESALYAIACLSVHVSVTRVDQSKTVEVDHATFTTIPLRYRFNP